MADVSKAVNIADLRVMAQRRLAGESQQARGAAEIDANYVRRSDAEIFWKG